MPPCPVCAGGGGDPRRGAGWTGAVCGCGDLFGDHQGEGERLPSMYAEGRSGVTVTVVCCWQCHHAVAVLWRANEVSCSCWMIRLSTCLPHLFGGVHVCVCVCLSVAQWTGIPTLTPRPLSTGQRGRRHSACLSCAQTSTPPSQALWPGALSLAGSVPPACVCV